MTIVYALPVPDSTTRQPISEESLNMALQDRRYLMRQLKCALGEAPCDPVGRRLKSKFSKKKKNTFVCISLKTLTKLSIKFMWSALIYY